MFRRSLFVLFLLVIILAILRLTTSNSPLGIFTKFVYINYKINYIQREQRFGYGDEIWNMKRLQIAKGDGGQQDDNMAVNLKV
jgi:hypothetical protein